MHKRVSIYILCDAMGWEVIRDLDFLQDLLPFRYRVRTVFGYSSAALPSIYTGVPPFQHGRWSMWYYAPEQSLFKKTKIVAALPEMIIGKKSINRKLLSWFYDHFGGVSDYFCIYDLPLQHLHKFNLAGYRDIYQPGAFDGIESIFDILLKQNVSHLILSWRTPSLNAFQTLMDDMRRTSREFYFIYIADFDSVLHKWGSDNREKIKPFLSWLAQMVRKIYGTAKGVYRSVTINLFSDHGMCNVEQVFDLRSIMQKLPVTEFQDYVPFYDSTMARFYTFSQQTKDLIMRQLAALPCGRILSADELKALGVFFPDNKFGNIIYLLNPGNLINPSFMGKTAPKAMHGYHPDHKDSFAAFLSTKEQKTPMNSICDFFKIMKADAM